MPAAAPMRPPVDLAKRMANGEELEIGNLKLGKANDPSFQFPVSSFFLVELKILNE